MAHNVKARTAYWNIIGGFPGEGVQFTRGLVEGLPHAVGRPVVGQQAARSTLVGAPSSGRGQLMRELGVIRMGILQA
jgi:hypothetical protein